MAPFTHLLGSWLIAAKTTDNLRDTRLVALAGVLPDADGLGLLVDLVSDAVGRKGSTLYHDYHHWLAHGLIGGIILAALLTCFAQRRFRVFLLAFAVFHLHLLCDLLGSRGPSPNDLWPIFYLGPVSRNPMWIWVNQWPLDGWQNKIIAVSLFLSAIWFAARWGHSVLGVFNQKLDRKVVSVLQQWQNAWFRVHPNIKSAGGR